MQTQWTGRGGRRSRALARRIGVGFRSGGGILRASAPADRTRTITGTLVATLVCLVLTAGSTGATATPLLSNGGFEEGMNAWEGSAIAYGAALERYPGWLVWSDYNNPYAPWYDNPPGVLPADGDSMTTFWPDSSVLGLLYQDFTVSQPGTEVTVSFDFYTEVVGVTDLGPCGLDRTVDPACNTTFWPGPVFRADILLGDADLYSVDPAEVLPLIEGDGGYTFPSVPYPFVHPEFDISDFVSSGGDFRIRFAAFSAEVTLLDNVSVSAIPEPGTALLLGLGLASLASRRRHLSNQRSRAARCHDG